MQHKLVAKLITVKEGEAITKEQLAEAGKAFNKLVTAYTADSLVDSSQTSANVASMRAFVAELGSNKEAWSQIGKIEELIQKGGDRVSDVRFSVKDDKAFFRALRNDARFFTMKVGDMLHLNSARSIGFTSSDPSFHVGKDGNSVGAHWDPTSPVNRLSTYHIVTGILTGSHSAVGQGVVEMITAGPSHFESVGGRAKVEDVQKFLRPKP